jgi:hypothetical protein
MHYLYANLLFFRRPQETDKPTRALTLVVPGNRSLMPARRGGTPIRLGSMTTGPSGPILKGPDGPLTGLVNPNCAGRIEKQQNPFAGTITFTHFL